MAEQPLRVVLCWHMHQPEYRDPVTGAFVEPWTLLHGLKDYTDMAAHLENAPAARAVVNFSPLVLDQIEALVDQLDACLADGTPPAEPLLAALAADEPPADSATRQHLLQACLRAHPERLVARHPVLARLTALARAVADEPGADAWVDPAFLPDLVCAYLLAWLGESVRDDARAERLLARAAGYSTADRRDLLALVRDTLAGLVPRWRALAADGRVELACNPWAHPILPLLLDFASAAEARPDTPLPAGHYPDGEARARRHVAAARTAHQSRFGVEPAGCWPSEGGVSDAALALIADAGFAWAATGQQVLRHSLEEDSEAPDDSVHQPRAVADGRLTCFFRDDGLSDRIGFTYQDWHADDAVGDFVAHLETIAEAASPGSVVSIILDGENAWEYYPRNGWHFLSALYERLIEHPGLELTTFSDCLADPAVNRPVLDHVVAGSWVHGDFATWIGDPQKNRAWELLLAARAAVDEAVAGGADWTEALERRLAVCEGSDWFWWPGEYNPAAAVAAFDALYRRHLAGLYAGVGLDPPAELDHAFAEGHGDPAAGGVMQTGS